VQAHESVKNGQKGGVLWFGPHAAHGTVYVPLVLAMEDTPDCLSWTYQGVYNMSNSFWAFRNVLNLAQIKFSYIIQDIQQAQFALESASVQLIGALTGAYSSPGGMDIDIDTRMPQEYSQRSSEFTSLSEGQYITLMLTLNAEAARDRFITLLHELMFKYGDGYVSSWDGGEGSGSGTGINTFHASSVGYPAWWLSGVGYSDGPA